MVSLTVPVFGTTHRGAAACTTNIAHRCVGIFQWEERVALNGETTTDLTTRITCLPKILTG